MPKITQVLTEADYDMALARISELLGAQPNTPEGRELDRISDLVIQYEDEHYPMEDPDPASLLEFLLDQQIVSREQLIPLAGGSDSLDAMLAGQTAITAEVARVLQEHSGLPIEYLIRTPMALASTMSADGILSASDLK